MTNDENSVPDPGNGANPPSRTSKVPHGRKPAKKKRTLCAYPTLPKYPPEPPRVLNNAPLQAGDHQLWPAPEAVLRWEQAARLTGHDDVVHWTRGFCMYGSKTSREAAAVPTDEAMEAASGCLKLINACGMEVRAADYMRRYGVEAHMGAMLFRSLRLIAGWKLRARMWLRGDQRLHTPSWDVGYEYESMMGQTARPADLLSLDRQARKWRIHVPEQGARVIDEWVDIALAPQLIGAHRNAGPYAVALSPGQRITFFVSSFVETTLTISSLEPWKRRAFVLNKDPNSIASVIEGLQVWMEHYATTATEADKPRLREQIREMVDLVAAIGMVRYSFMPAKEDVEAAGIKPWKGARLW